MRGVLAAWLADQCLLGREEQGWAELERRSKRGVLGAERLLADGCSLPAGATRVPRKTGYA